MSKTNPIPIITALISSAQYYRIAYFNEKGEIKNLYVGRYIKVAVNKFKKIEPVFQIIILHSIIENNEKKKTEVKFSLEDLKNELKYLNPNVEADFKSALMSQ